MRLQPAETLQYGDYPGMPLVEPVAGAAPAGLNAFVDEREVATVANADQESHGLLLKRSRVVSGLRRMFNQGQ